MDTAAKPHWPTVALTILLSLFACILLPVGVYNVRQRSDWALADWLINYSGGFVRRGLTGSFAMLGKPLHVPPADVILCLQLALYVTILITVWTLLRNIRWTIPLVALVFSPATLQFPLMDPNFAFRKEILFFALLGALLCQLRARVAAAPVIALLSCGCAVCVLSHEALIVFFPYLFGALWLQSPRSYRPLAVAVLPALTAGVLFVAISTHPGNSATAKAVCSSLGGTLTQPPSGLCGGAIAYLSRSSADARQDVHRVAFAGRYSHIMPVLILLSLLPIALQLRALWVAGTRRECKVILTAALISMGASTELFLYGTDWTRWIYIHAFSLMFLLISVAPRNTKVTFSGKTRSPPTLFTGNQPKRWGLVAFLASYIFAWHLSLYQPKVPLGGLIHYLRKTHLASIDQASGLPARNSLRSQAVQ